jgi:hypothetical protein
VISDNDFKGIKGQTLIKSDKKLSGPGNSKLNVLGKFQCMLESQDKFSVQEFLCLGFAFIVNCSKKSFVLLLIYGNGSNGLVGQTTFCEMSHI